MVHQTAAYWQRTQNHSALLLQQYRSGSCPVSLIAVCSGGSEAQGRAGAYITEQMLQWFRGLPFQKLARSPEKQVSALKGELAGFMARRNRELVSCGLLEPGGYLPLSGMMCVEESFLIFRQGRQEIYLLNKAFGRGSVQELGRELGPAGEAEALALEQGVLQKDVGLLFATTAFARVQRGEDLRECLYVEELGTEEQLDRRLRELGERGEALGGRDMGAVLFLARP